MEISSPMWSPSLARNVAHALVRAASRLVSTPKVHVKGRRRDEYPTALRAVVKARKSQMHSLTESTTCGRLSGESRRGTHECVRHMVVGAAAMLAACSGPAGLKKEAAVATPPAYFKV